MCLGIPGQIVETNVRHEHLARVEVNGVGRVINVALLEDEKLEVGDWVLIHVGFAISKVNEEEAKASLEFLEGMGRAFTDELDAIRSSTDQPPERSG